MMQKSSLIPVLLVFLLAAACKPLPFIPSETETGKETAQENPSNPGTASSPKELEEQYLLAAYTFNGQNADCLRPLEWDGVTVGDPQFISDTPDGTGYALFLNGMKQQFVNIPYNFFQGLNQFSITLWVKDIYTGSVFTGIHTGHNRCLQMHFPRIYFAADGKVSFCINNVYSTLDGAPAFEYSYASIQSDAWHHIAVTVYASSEYAPATVKLYVDGSLCGTMSDVYFNHSNEVTKIQLGGNGDGDFPVWFSGKIDNVNVYSAALSADVVAYIYQNKL